MTLSKSVFFLLFGATATITTTAASASTTRTNTNNVKISSNININNSNDANKKILHFPIIPHNEVMRRNRRLQSNNNSNENNNNLRNLERDPEPYYNFNTTLEVGGLYQGYGTHYIDLWVGTPPQRQTVIVDTGSGITAFPCESCRDCGSEYHVDKFFQESQSSSFVKFGCDQCVGARCMNGNGKNVGSGGHSKNKSNEQYCHLSVSYQEGSMWNAYEGQDVTYVGGLHDAGLDGSESNEEGSKLHSLIHGEDPLNAVDFQFDMVFGCQTRITGLFKTQLADGIMGMCLKPSSIFNQMHDQNLISSPSFSLCFTRAEEAEKDGTIAGALTMGGSDTRLHSPYTPMVYAHGFPTKGVMHGVNVRKIYLMESGSYAVEEVNKKNTRVVNISYENLNTGSIIVDSGTTDTYMTRNLRQPFAKAFKEMTGFEYAENGMKLSDMQVKSLPTIVIQLEGHVDDNKNVKYEEGEAYVGEEERDSDYAPGLAGIIDEEFPYDILIVIPPAHYIEFDSDHNKYVGRFSLTESGGSVLGANTIRGHDVYFDIPDNDRIGFAPSDCDYYNLIGGGNGSDDEEVERVTPGDDENDDVNRDDYYEENNSSNDNGDDEDDDRDRDDFVGDVDHDSSSSTIVSIRSFTSSLFLAISVITVTFLIAYTMVILYRRATGGPRYSATDISGNHLDDLHLDTEIEKLPAIA